MEKTFNIYVADTKKGNTRLKDFPGLSLGEVRSFILDLTIRDMKKGTLSFTKSSPQLSNVLGINESMANLSETQTIKQVPNLSKQVENIIYDKMSTHEIMTTVWAFSDKTLIIVRAS